MKTDISSPEPLTHREIEDTCREVGTVSVANSPNLLYEVFHFDNKLKEFNNVSKKVYLFG